MKISKIIAYVAIPAFMVSCGTGNDTNRKTTPGKMEEKVKEYALFKLTTDISKLSGNEKKMIPILIHVADIMDEIYWKQTFGDKQKLFSEIADESAKQFAMINYGPWDRLDGDKPFVEKYGEKPKGANFYPADITKEEFEKFNDTDKTSWYTILKRKSDKSLELVWYHHEFKAQIEKAAELLKQAAALAEDPGLKNYFELRAKALLTDDYLESDLAWMDMKNNTIDMVVGPIENYDDQLFGYKAAQSGQLLVKDKAWSERLARYGALMPKLQESLPVDDKYKKEKPGVDSDMNVYDAIYCAGDCNSGSKNIAINLPNDERVHAKKGSRKLQLKNSMQAKFEKILVPISNLMMTEDQRGYVKFDAFFENVMFHEVAHGLGIKKTIDQKATVRDALKDYYAAIEEAKADILGLYFVSKLAEMGEMKGKDIRDNYVTFFAGIFRSVRFGVSNAHGKANMLTFYWFHEKGAFMRDEKTGLYQVNFDKIKEAVSSLGAQLLAVEGDGNYAEAKKWVDAKGNIAAGLQKDLDRIAKAEIPRDIVFEQGLKALGL
ncbi:MAG: Zn-dependent hydrolase [Bacteroidia bacterium]|nr:Zn-dependent hydrolase [Bacteroidia bacterium]